MNEGEAEVLVPRRLIQSTGWLMVGWWLGGVGWIYFRSSGGLCWRVFAQWWYGRKSWYHFSLWLSGLGGESKGGEVFESCKNPMESKIHERFCLGNKEKWLDICDELTEISGSSTWCDGIEVILCIQVLLLYKRSSQVFVWGWTKVKLLRRMLRSRGIRTGLHGVEVNSVDGFQGREKEARFWRISGEVQYPPFNATEKQMAWKFTWNYILFWGVRWWWCVTFMCGDAELLTLGLDQPFGFRSLWSVPCDQIWRMPPASFETGDASMLPWPVQSRFPQEQVLPKAFNMNSLTYWTKIPPKVGMVKNL